MSVSLQARCRALIKYPPAVEVLTHIIFACRKSQFKRDNATWTVKTEEELISIINMSKDQIRRGKKRLIEEGLIVAEFHPHPIVRRRIFRACWLRPSDRVLNWLEGDGMNIDDNGSSALINRADSAPTDHSSSAVVLHNKEKKKEVLLIDEGEDTAPEGHSSLGKKALTIDELKVIWDEGIKDNDPDYYTDAPWAKHERNSAKSIIEKSPADELSDAIGYVASHWPDFRHYVIDKKGWKDIPEAPAIGFLTLVQGEMINFYRQFLKNKKLYPHQVDKNGFIID